MARNGSGTYSKAVSSFSPSGSIKASDHNSLWDDLVSEITNSVAADGQTTMTGPLKAASGSKSLPSLAFASDADTGVYLSSANEVSIVASASQVAIFAASAAQINVPTLFIATATFQTGIAVSQTAVFSHPVLMSGTATFTNGFLASNTCSFSHPILVSGTATFTNGFLASNTCSFSHPILVSGTATFTKGFIASATASFSGANPVIATNTAKAWCVIQPGGTTILAGYNVTSVARTGGGDYTLTFTTAMSSVNYVVCITGGNDARFGYVKSKGTTTCRIGISTVAPADSDPNDSIMVLIFGA